MINEANIRFLERIASAIERIALSHEKMIDIMNEDRKRREAEEVEKLEWLRSVGEGKIPF